MIDYDFDEHARLIIKGEMVPHGDLIEILDKYTDGLCQRYGCGNLINVRQLFCDSCCGEAKHNRDPGFPETATQ